RPDKGQGHNVDTVLKTEFQVFAIFVGQGRNAESDTWQINALMLGEQSAVDDFAFDVFACYADDSEFNTPVRKQNARAGLDFLGQALKGRSDEFGCTWNIAWGDRDPGSALQFNWRLPFEASSADFGALQVLQDADAAAFLARNAAEPSNVAGVILVGA